LRFSRVFESRFKNEHPFTLHDHRARSLASVCGEQKLKKVLKRPARVQTRRFFSPWPFFCKQPASVIRPQFPQFMGGALKHIFLQKLLLICAWLRLYLSLGHMASPLPPAPPTRLSTEEPKNRRTEGGEKEFQGHARDVRVIEPLSTRG
jgi:hypothetical protein